VKETIIVTGGLGYIGTVVAEKLWKADYLPLVVDNQSTSRFATSDSNFPVILGNYGDKEVLKETLKHHPTAIIHLANSAYVGESIENPSKYFTNNVAETAQMLDWAGANDIKQIVFSSSCATYGAPGVAQISEDTPQRPINPYGESKLMIERMLDWLDKLSGFRHVTLRYFNVAGDSQICNSVDAHDPETHLIPNLIKSAKQGQSFLLNGNDFETEDGSAVRDFIHVDDLAEAHLLALSHLKSGKGSLKVNLGTGVGTSVLEMVSLIQERFGHINIEIVPQRVGDSARLVAKVDLAEKILGWIPNYRTAEDIVSTLKAKN
jgi:UDP-glucose-4-epimerase GalE